MENPDPDKLAGISIPQEGYPELLTVHNYNSGQQVSTFSVESLPSVKEMLLNQLNVWIPHCYKTSDGVTRVCSKTNLCYECAAIQKQMHANYKGTPDTLPGCGRQSMAQVENIRDLETLAFAQQVTKWVNHYYKDADGNTRACTTTSLCQVCTLQLREGGNSRSDEVGSGAPYRYDRQPYNCYPSVPNIHIHNNIHTPPSGNTNPSVDIRVSNDNNAPPNIAIHNNIIPENYYRERMAETKNRLKSSMTKGNNMQHGPHKDNTLVTNTFDKNSKPSIAQTPILLNKLVASKESRNIKNVHTSSSTRPKNDCNRVSKPDHNLLPNQRLSHMAPYTSSYSNYSMSNAVRLCNESANFNISHHATPSHGTNNPRTSLIENVLNTELTFAQDILNDNGINMYNQEYDAWKRSAAVTNRDQNSMISSSKQQLHYNSRLSSSQYPSVFTNQTSTTQGISTTSVTHHQVRNKCSTDTSCNVSAPTTSSFLIKDIMSNDSQQRQVIGSINTTMKELCISTSPNVSHHTQGRTESVITNYKCNKPSSREFVASKVNHAAKSSAAHCKKYEPYVKNSKKYEPYTNKSKCTSQEVVTKDKMLVKFPFKKRSPKKCLTQSHGAADDITQLQQAKDNSPGPMTPDNSQEKKRSPKKCLSQSHRASDDITQLQQIKDNSPHPVTPDNSQEQIISHDQVSVGTSADSCTITTAQTTSPPTITDHVSSNSSDVYSGIPGFVVHHDEDNVYILDRGKIRVIPTKEYNKNVQDIMVQNSTADIAIKVEEEDSGYGQLNMDDTTIYNDLRTDRDENGTVTQTTDTNANNDVAQYDEHSDAPVIPLNTQLHLLSCSSLGETQQEELVDTQRNTFLQSEDATEETIGNEGYAGDMLRNTSQVTTQSAQHNTVPEAYVRSKKVKQNKKDKKKPKSNSTDVRKQKSATQGKRKFVTEEEFRDAIQGNVPDHNTKVASPRDEGHANNIPVVTLSDSDITPNETCPKPVGSANDVPVVTLSNSGITPNETSPSPVSNDIDAPFMTLSKSDITPEVVLHCLLEEARLLKLSKRRLGEGSSTMLVDQSVSVEDDMFGYETHNKRYRNNVNTTSIKREFNLSELNMNLRVTLRDVILVSSDDEEE